MPLKLKRLTIPGDKDTRIYFSHTQLADHPEGAEYGMEVESAVLEAALEVPGVAAAEVHGYHLSILKTPMYSWDEVEPKLLVLMTALNLELPEEKETPDAPTEN